MHIFGVQETDLTEVGTRNFALRSSAQHGHSAKWWQHLQSANEGG